MSDCLIGTGVQSRNAIAMFPAEQEIYTLCPQEAQEDQHRTIEDLTHQLLGQKSSRSRFSAHLLVLPKHCNRLLSMLNLAAGLARKEQQSKAGSGTPGWLCSALHASKGHSLVDAQQHLFAATMTCIHEQPKGYHVSLDQALSVSMHVDSACKAK